MEIIHADSLLAQLQVLQSYSFDAVAGLATENSDNDFELIVPEESWLAEPIQLWHFLFEENSEWGGRVEGIEHVGSDIKLTGPTWRGMLARKIVKPPTGEAYKTITEMEANAAIGELIGTSFGTLVAASLADSGIVVSGSFRYDNLLSAIHEMLANYGARLKVIFDGTVVTLSAELVSDLSDTTEMSQDYAVPIRSSIKHGESYNHVIALGTGVLTARTTVEYYRDDTTEIISATPLPDGIDDRQYVFDYPNAESLAVLQEAAQKSLAEYAPITKVEIDLSEAQNLQLGDIVGGRDQITGLSIKKAITQKILTINSDGEKYQYKVGE